MSTFRVDNSSNQLRETNRVLVKCFAPDLELGTALPLGNGIDTG